MARKDAESKINKAKRKPEGTDHVRRIQGRLDETRSVLAKQFLPARLRERRTMQPRHEADAPGARSSDTVASTSHSSEAPLAKSYEGSRLCFDMVARTRSVAGCPASDFKIGRKADIVRGAKTRHVSSRRSQLDSCGEYARRVGPHNRADPSAQRAA